MRLTESLLEIVKPESEGDFADAFDRSLRKTKIGEDESFDGRAKVTVIPFTVKRKVQVIFDIHSKLFELCEPVQKREKPYRARPDCEICRLET